MERTCSPLSAMNEAHAAPWIGPGVSRKRATRRAPQPRAAALTLTHKFPDFHF